MKRRIERLVTTVVAAARVAIETPFASKPEFRVGRAAGIEPLHTWRTDDGARRQTSSEWIRRDYA